MSFLLTLDKEIKQEEEKLQRIRLAHSLEQETKSGRKKISALKEKRKQEMAMRLKQIKERQSKPQVMQLFLFLIFSKENSNTNGTEEVPVIEEVPTQQEEEEAVVNIEEKDIDDFLRAARLGLLS